MNGFWRDIQKIDFVGQGTPLISEPGLATIMGVRSLSVKRDDLLQLALGGNKTRKLQFLLADVLQSGANTVITAGGPNSNHCLQTAAGASKLGLECHFILTGDAPSPSDPRGANNQMMEDLFGATLHYVGDADRPAAMEQLSGELSQEDRIPYIIPIGGSNGLGALGYVEAVDELARDLVGLEPLKTIVIATCSGGTQAGIQLGMKILGLDIELVGIGVDQERDSGFEEELAMIANQAAELLNSPIRLSPADFTVNYDFVGPYGVMSENEKIAFQEFARATAVPIDPAYTARAANGMKQLLAEGKLSKEQHLLFWHTGGKGSHLCAS